MYLNFELQV